MYLALNELIETIGENVNRLQQGEMEIEEMENHLSLVRELYDRTVILKYKALEVMGGEKEAIPSKVETAVEVLEIQPDLIADESIQEPIVQLENKEEITEEVEYDLFGNFFEEETETLGVTVVENEPVAPDFEGSTSSAQSIETEESPALSNEMPQPLIEVELKETTEEVKQEIPQRETYNDQIVSAFKIKLFEVNAEVSKQFGFSPLNTLIGSFGLNERLLYINELFSGSSDAFSTAVKELDVKANLTETTPIVMKYANDFMWDIESPTVEEFMQKICRRYA